MNTISNNVSAICRLKTGIAETAIQNKWAFASMLNGNPDAGLLYGTEDGEVYYYNSSIGKNFKLFSEPSHLRILQISTNNNIVGILTEGNMEENEDEIMQYSFIYHLNLKTLDKAQKVGINGDYFFTPFSMLMYNNSFYGAYFAEKNSFFPIRNIEYFESDENLYDAEGFYFAINKYTATVYTLNIYDRTNWQEDTFSFEGRLLTQLRMQLSENQDSETYSMISGDLDDMTQEIVNQENILNKMLHPSMVRVGHNPYTSLDFVKMAPSDNPQNPYVISGGRDGKILVTNFIEHKVFFDETFDCIPRSCCVSGDKIYVGCDEGIIVIIDICTFKYRILTGIGEQDITRISADNKYIIAVNLDNAAFCLNAHTGEICGFEICDDDVIDVTVCRGVPFILDGAGNLYEMI